MAEQLFQVGVKALVRDGQGRILLLREARHSNSYWDLPGGRMDEGEDFMQTLKRELREEIDVQTFYNPTHLSTVLSNKKITDDRGQFGLLLVVFSVQIPDKNEVQSLEADVLYEWFEPAEASVRLADKFSGDFCKTIKDLQ